MIPKDDVQALKEDNYKENLLLHIPKLDIAMSESL